MSMSKDYSKHEDSVTQPGGKPCRACSDFKAWMKLGPKDLPKANPTTPNKSTAEEAKFDTATAKDPKSETSANSDISSPDNSDLIDQASLDAKNGICPPDRGELGSATWTFLHSVAAYFPATPTPDQQNDAKQLMQIVSRLYPCTDCADDLKTDLQSEPPVVTSSVEFSQWMCRLHNKVNDKLGKPTFDCSKVFERWRDGWKDGSCD